MSYSRFDLHILEDTGTVLRSAGKGFFVQDEGVYTRD